MKNSGYSQTYRKDTVVAAKKGIEGKLRQAEEGLRSYYRLQNEGARDRYRSKMSKKSNWFKKSAKKEAPQVKPALRKRKAQLENKEKVPEDNRPVDVVVFIPHTNNSSLKNLLQLTDDRVTKPFKGGYLNVDTFSKEESLVSTPRWMSTSYMLSL